MMSWSDVRRHNRCCKHDKKGYEGSASKRHEESREIMECNNFGFFDVHDPCSTASLELEATEAKKMMRFVMPGPPDFSNANAVS